MYKIHISVPLNDSNLVYKHSHFKKILNYLKNNNLKEFYVFSSNHDAIIVNHKYIFWKLSKSYQRKISSTIKVEVFSTREVLTEQFAERMRQASYNARIHSENLGIKFYDNN